MKFTVSNVNQRSGGVGNYVVKFDADVEVLASGSGVRIEVISTIPPDAEPAMVELAKKYIGRGAESVLGARGAVFRLSHLFIHEADFNVKRFETTTAIELRKALEANAQ